VRDAAPGANYINHIAIVADESWSMEDHARALIQVVDNQTRHLAQRSKDLDQETRITFYTFASCDDHRCLWYDKDVLRLPSLSGLYRPRGRTALIDCTRLAISDLRQTAQLYGQHAFLIYVLSDGQNNDSRSMPRELAADIAGMPGNWTIAAFAPDQTAVWELKGCGFPPDNISVWNTTSATGLEDVGRAMRDTADMWMEGRAQGVHGYNAKSGRGLFKLRDFSAAEVTSQLPPLTKGSYTFHLVPVDERIDQFVARVTGRSYENGRAYYQFMKTETIQGHKGLAVEVGGEVYTGKAARGILGLPDCNIRVKPDQKPGCVIFVQSTSFNRKLIGGTRLLLLR
jgi:hypothetical protein